jgi:hypothetical protein
MAGLKDTQPRAVHRSADKGCCRRVISRLTCATSNPLNWLWRALCFGVVHL